MPGKSALSVCAILMCLWSVGCDVPPADALATTQPDERLSSGLPFRETPADRGSHNDVEKMSPASAPDVSRAETPVENSLPFTTTQPGFLRVPDLPARAGDEPRPAGVLPPAPPRRSPRRPLPAADASAVEFSMPGKGAPTDAGEPAVRQQAARQAAVFVAMYNVTKEINPTTYTDTIEGGFVHSDGYRYKAGLEIKSQTTVLDGKVTQFDIWLTASAGEGQEKLQVHVRNFALSGGPLDETKFERLLNAAGGHLVVLSVNGPDDHGLYTAEVGLARKIAD